MSNRTGADESCCDSLAMKKFKMPNRALSDCQNQLNSFYMFKFCDELTENVDFDVSL